MTIPLVGGEPARLILDTIRSFPLSVRHDGRVQVEIVAAGETLASFTRAYEATELDVMRRAFECDCAEEHRTLDEQDFTMLVLGAMVDRARVLLNDLSIDAVWI